MPNAVAVIVLYDQEKKILLQLRTAYKPQWADYWSLFGGHLNDGEDPLTGLKREVLEELGYRLNNPVFVYTQNRPDKPEKPKHVFIEKYDPNQILKPDPIETQKTGWYTLAQARRLKIIPHDLEVLEKVENFIKHI